MKKFKGILECTNEEYHSEKEHLSSSNYKSLLKDPAKFYKEKILGEREDFPQSTLNAFDEGSYAHTLILEPEMVEKEYRFFDGLRKQGQKWEDFKADPANQGYVLLSKAQKIKVHSWVDAYKQLPTAVELVSGGFAEHTLFSELDGVKSKVRADYINIDKGYIADVKTTSGMTDVDSFKFTVDSFMYDLSAALYCKLFEDHYGKKFDFYFIVLGKRDSSCEVYKLSSTSKAEGMRKVNKALDIYKKCKKSGIWQLQDEDNNDNIEKDGYEILLI